MGKAVKMEFSLILLGVAVTWGSKWKAKMAAEWEELAEWRPMTTIRRPSMEQLLKKFVGMEMWGAAPVKSPTQGIVLGMGQALGHFIPFSTSSDVLSRVWQGPG